ncbi:MAG TPA: purine-nucleoside phosphorylase [Candidatus Aphodomonas merdavium]|nr:purine-nucleoside phosphorylase [Candidatus Aphodomonas merdavium]
MATTPHIDAMPGDFAKTVLMPGDPLRSEHIAKTYLKDAKLVNNVRGVQGYTGLYNGKRVSVMASGMGMPAIGIYSYELFHYFQVENIIRIGTCGGLSSSLDVRDLCAAMSSFTTSSYAHKFGFAGTIAPTASYSLLRAADEAAKRMQIKLHIGTFLCSDIFYGEDEKSLEAAQKLGVLAVEMESAALYLNAMEAGKNALCLCTVSDMPGNELTPQERQKSLDEMFRLALEIA